MSLTALNRTIQRGDEQVALFFMYDGTVTENCACKVNALRGTVEVLLSRDVPGNSVVQRHTDRTLPVFKAYPGIKIVAETQSCWLDHTAQRETAWALAARPTVQGVRAQAGAYGVIQALMDAGDLLVPMTRDNSAGFRCALADPDIQAKGLRGVPSGSGPAQSGQAMKLAMAVLTGARELPPPSTDCALPWRPAAAFTLCAGDICRDGCNLRPAAKVFASLVLNLIQRPEINCAPCGPAPDMYRLTKVEATVQP